MDMQSTVCVGLELERCIQAYAHQRKLWKELVEEEIRGWEAAEIKAEAKLEEARARKGFFFRKLQELDDPVKLCDIRKRMDDICRDCEEVDFEHLEKQKRKKAKRD